MAEAEWKRIYDLICRLWSEIERDVTETYRQGVNRILAAYGVVWELTEQGHLQRYLPSETRTLINSAIVELNVPRFAPALELMNAARSAFDDRPRRDRDACTNIFDCMESVSKEIFNMPNDTFGSVLSHVRTTGALQNDVISVLDAINTLRNHKFGHGMTVPFDLSNGEVDFTYMVCIGAILLFLFVKI